MVQMVKKQNGELENDTLYLQTERWNRISHPEHSSPLINSYSLFFSKTVDELNTEIQNFIKSSSLSCLRFALLFAATSLWNLPTLQSAQTTCSQRKFLGVNGTFPGKVMWSCLIHIVIKIVPETCVKELLLAERARATCNEKSIPTCSSTIHIESFTSSNICFQM